jgi:hypothetical protein
VLTRSEFSQLAVAPGRSLPPLHSGGEPRKPSIALNLCDTRRGGPVLVEALASGAELAGGTGVLVLVSLERAAQQSGLHAGPTPKAAADAV